MVSQLLYKKSGKVKSGEGIWLTKSGWIAREANSANDDGDRRRLESASSIEK